jgi:hypothetical protein
MSSKGITKATMVSKVNNGVRGHCCNSVLQKWPLVVRFAEFLEKEATDKQTDRYGRVHKVFFAQARA